MPATLTGIPQQLLQNSTNPDVVKQHRTPDVTYESLDFDNSDLQKVLPWTGTNKARSAYRTVKGVMTFLKALDLKIAGPSSTKTRRRSLAASPTKVNATGKEITSPFCLFARFEGDKVASIQFLDYRYGTATSFRPGGRTRFHSEPSGKVWKAKGSRYRD